MKSIIKLCAITLVGAGLATSACGSSDDSSTSSGGKGGAGGKGGSSATGGVGGKGGSTATGGVGGKGGSTAAGGSGATAGTGTGGSATAGAAGAPEGAAGEGGAFGTAPAFSEPPALGAQIDRMGRPGVNTALTDPFDIVTAKTEDAVKNAYNAEADPTKWSGEFKAYIAQNLAIFDALDSTAAVNGCGNQFAIGAAATSPNRYDPLATVLVDDRLYVNTAGATCGQYLAVEANATGIIPNADCGGRTPTYDVIDTTYSVLAVGALTGVTDGVPTDGKTTATFPFLAAPQ